MQKQLSSDRVGWVMIVPVVAGLALFAILPFFYLLVLSFTKSSLTAPMSAFVGIDNFLRAVLSADFRSSLVLTAIFAFIVSTLQLILGFILALLFDKITKAAGLLRALMLLPLMTPPVMVGIAWKLILSPSGGLVNGWLMSLGWISTPISFFGSPSLAFLSLIIADSWQWTPFVALLCYAALKTLPIDVYEAATLDGAYPWRQLRTITLPMMKPAFVSIFLIKLVIAFKTFDLVYILTFGGPGTSTGLSSFSIWRTTLRQFDIGSGAAMTLIFVVVVTLITLPVVAYYSRLSRLGRR